MPPLSDILGGGGVALILLAYFLNLAGRLTTGQVPYLLLNLTGASLACASSVLLGSLPFTVLEGVWAAVSAVALVQRLTKK